MTACVVIHASRSTRGCRVAFRSGSVSKRRTGADWVLRMCSTSARGGVVEAGRAPPAGASGESIMSSRMPSVTSLTWDCVGHLVQACLLVLAEALEFRLRERHGLVLRLTRRRWVREAFVRLGGGKVREGGRWSSRAPGSSRRGIPSRRRRRVWTCPAPPPGSTPVSRGPPWCGAPPGPAPAILARSPPGPPTARSRAASSREPPPPRRSGCRRSPMNRSYSAIFIARARCCCAAGDAMAASRARRCEVGGALFACRRQASLTTAARSQRSRDAVRSAPCAEFNLAFFNDWLHMRTCRIFAFPPATGARFQKTRVGAE